MKLLFTLLVRDLCRRKCGNPFNQAVASSLRGSALWPPETRFHPSQRIFLPVASRGVPGTDSFHGDYHDNRCAVGELLSRPGGAAWTCGPAGGSVRTHLLAPITGSGVRPLDETSPTRTHPAQDAHDGSRLSHELVDIEASDERSPELAGAVRLLHVCAVPGPPCAPDPRWHDWWRAPKKLNPRHGPSAPGSCFSRRRANPERLQGCAGARHGGGVRG